VAAQTFSTLNALRGAAAIAVATTHWRSAFGPYYAHSGYLAVDLFFLISGFVVAFSYDARLSSGWTLSHFLRLRFVRFYPMYILGVCITLCGIFLLHSQDRMGASLSEIGAAFLCNGFMLPSFPMGQSYAVFPLNSPAWTLYLELICNLLYALLHRFTGPRNLLLSMALSAAALTTVALVFGTINLGFSSYNFFVGFFRVGFSFSTGVLLCRAYRANLLPRLRVPGVMIILLCLAALLYQPVIKAPFELLCVFLLFPLAIIAAVRSSVHTAISDILGNISYPLYALHMPVLAIILVLFGGGSPSALAFTALICLLALLPACWALDRWIDRTIRVRWSKPPSRHPNPSVVGPLSVA
jgi:peptidoglycan/LPS O-acetylase OafA/YrhL